MVAAVIGAVLVGAVLGGSALVYRHLYRMPLFDPAAVPERVVACGRNFRLDDSSVVTDRYGAQSREPGRAPLTQVDVVTAPWHRPMLVFGRPQEPPCGGEVFFFTDPDNIKFYTLQGGP